MQLSSIYGRIEKRLRWPRACLGLGQVAALMLLASGCSSLQELEVVDWPTPEYPAFSEERILGHLRFLNGQEAGVGPGNAAGREMGTAYVAAQMSGLQPGLAGSYRIHREAAGGGVNVFGAAEEGVDFLVDVRSDTGEAIIRSLVYCPDGRGGGLEEVDAFIVPASRASDGLAQTLVSRGARVLILIGGLESEQEEGPVAGLLIVRLTVASAERLFGLETAFSSCEGWQLAEPIPLRVHGSGAHTRPATSVIGLLAGKDPGLAGELVLVCTEIDAQDGIGEGTAALIELAQRYRSFMTTELFPGRSLMFGVFYGSDQGHVGLGRYLDQPLWPLAETRAVLYIGMDPAEEPVIRRMLEARGLEVHIIATAQAAPAGGDEAAALRAGAREGLRLVRAAHARLSRLAVSSSGDRP